MPLRTELSKTRAMQGHAWLCLAWPCILVLPSPRVYKAHHDLSSFFIYYLMSIARLWKIARNFLLLVRVISISLLHSHLREGEKYNNVGWLIDLFIASSCGFSKISKIKESLVLEFTWQRETKRAASFKIT